RGGYRHGAATGFAEHRPARPAHRHSFCMAARDAYETNVPKRWLHPTPHRIGSAMKYTVKVAQTTYEVEIDDIHARPVIARVNGQSFEVIPEADGGPVASREMSLSHPVA